MKEQHTPGPWHRNIPPATKYCTIFAGRNEHIVAIHHAKAGGEAEANHNLICAAPALLAALERLAGCYSDSRPAMLWADVSVKEASDAWQTARAAIASARGQS